MPTDSPTAKTLMLWAAPGAALMAGVALVLSGVATPVAITAGVAIWCALWWMFEPVPIPVTSLIPIAIFPLTGVLSGKDVAEAYGHPLILLLLGGFLLSQAMTSTQTHRFIAIRLIHIIGTHSPQKVVVGFGVTAAALSMWISNTATTLMLLPIALAMVSTDAPEKLKVALFLAIAYCASVGGVATPIGTPPNLIFIGAYQQATGIEITFSGWMVIALPITLTLIPLILFWLCRELPSVNYCFKSEDLPAFKKKNFRLLIVFGLTALAWITRKEPLGGWSGLFDVPTANDAGVALAAVVALFIIPNGEGGRLITWEDANKIPWGILLLFAGGLTLAAAFGETGLTSLIAEQMQGVASIHTLLMMLLITTAMIFLTEITSNTATTTLFMPVLAAIGIGAGVDPILLMVPAAIAASCAFMLPVATASNAIVYSSGHIPIQAMIRQGFAINLIAVLVITGWSFVLL